MNSPSPFIAITDLAHRYARDGATPIQALRGVDLTLSPGEFVAVVGANGSGKTTLARHLNALLLPTAGQVAVDGLDTRDTANWPAIRSRVTMVFQRPEDQIIATTVEDDVAFGPENLGLSGEEIRERVRWALDTVGMWALRRRPPHFLSAGQQQRVAIAGALAMRPRCLVLDEATAMLDPAGRRAVLALLGALHAEGLAVVMITHHMREVTAAERVVALAEGQVAFDGSPRRLFSDPQRLAALGLEPPPLAALALALSRRCSGLSPALFSLDELAAELTPRLRRNGSTAAPPPAPAPPRTEPPLIAVRDLGYTYLADTPLAAVALDGIDLSVYAGEALALLGPTGSGKSTLLQQIAGLSSPTAGRVLIAGKAATDAAEPAQGRKRVGMLFQKPEEQLFETYVGDDVAFGPRQLGLEGQALRERVRRAMETVGLPFAAYKDRFTQGLSGGEKRKAALAGVLALRPRVLLLDEPTAGLDPSSRRELLATLRRLNREQGMTLLVATHAMEDVATLADRAVVLRGGRVAAQGTPRELFRQPDLMAAHGLEVPEITALVQRLRANGAGLPVDLLTVQEAVTVLEGALKC